MRRWRHRGRSWWPLLGPFAAESSTLALNVLREIRDSQSAAVSATTSDTAVCPRQMPTVPVLACPLSRPPAQEILILTHPKRTSPSEWTRRALRPRTTIGLGDSQ